MQNKYKPLFLIGFIFFLLVAVYVFVVIQVIISYPFYLPRPPAHWGFENVFGSLTYTQLFEIGIVVSFVCLVLLGISYFKKNNILSSLGRAIAIYAGIGAIGIYVETNILWGKFWHWTDYTFWSGFPGGGGYPWGMERVANNLGWIKAPNFIENSNPDVYFLNYDELFFICLIAVIVGLILYHHYKAKKLEIWRDTGKLS